MAKSIKQIQQELETLESRVAETGQELQKSYDRYLELLTQSATQQLILASYQLCTQVYPKSFLSLSLSEKQELQQKLRALGKEVQPLIVDCGAREGVLPVRRELDLLAEMLQNLPITSIPKEQTLELGKEKTTFPSEQLSSNLQQSSSSEPEAETEDEVFVDSPLFDKLASLKESLTENAQNLNSSRIEDAAEPISDSDVEETNTAATIFSSEENANGSPQQLQELDFKNPEHLLVWHQQVERKIKQALNDLSVKANKCLQETRIIPERLPSKIIEVAIQAEESGANGSDRKLKNLPNILSLVIETDKEKKLKPSNIKQIDLLRLRLSEIEFTDAMLNVRRNQIRSVIDKISKLQRRHQHLKEDYTIAEAEAAWRSSWYED